MADMQVTGPIHERFDEILTTDALYFLASLHREFDARRRELLDARSSDTRSWRREGRSISARRPEASETTTRWRVAEPAPGLVDRRAEITGPTDAKMAINALNSGARVWLADHEDANTPLWENMVQGQVNLQRRGRGHARPSPRRRASTYELADDPATIVVRPRGWHLPEKHVLVDGEPMSGSLFDFGLYFFHNARPQLDRGSGPYFYLPKMESHLEARLWNDVFVARAGHARHPAGQRSGRPC